MNVREYVAGSAWSRADVEYFLDPSSPSWARFDPDTGYVPADVCIRDGLDGAHTFGSYRPDGARSMTRYADRPCRIDTYGDSFTQCHQVSDGETWQEVLAAHLGEPIRNFGVGGFGVYQALCRMRARAAVGDTAPYLVLNIYDDDHVRNLDAARWFRLGGFRSALGARLAPMLHANPWAHLRWDPTVGAFVERPNPMSTPQSLYQLADPDALVSIFGADEVVALECLRTGIDVDDPDVLASLRALAESFGLPFEPSADGAAELLAAYGLRSTLHTLDLTQAFAAQVNAQLMVLLSYGATRIQEQLRGEPRFDQALLEGLQSRGIPYVDALAAHQQDAGEFAGAPQTYTGRYLHGHYTPVGNTFFAFAIKNMIVDWLEPKPPAYPGVGAPFASAVGLLA